MRGFSADESSDFSKYFPAEDRSSLYNYSTSYNNETLLLETTDIQKGRPAPTLNILQENELERSRSLLEDLYEQLEATVSHGELHREGEGRLEGAELYDVCKQLMGTLRRLESKVERMDDSKKGWDAHKEVESVLTYSSLQASKGSKGCRCETQKSGLANLLEYVQYRSKLDLYREENEQLKRQVIQLQIGNEEARKHVRRLQCENMRIKELLKQYQLNPKHKGNQLLVGNDRRTHLRSGNLIEQPVLRHQMRSDGKENIKQLLECRIREEEARLQFKQTPMTPNPLLRIVKNSTQKTETKHTVGGMDSRERIEQLSQRVGQLLDFDNQKTHSKSKQTKGKKLQSRQSFAFREMLQQSNYQVQAEKDPLPTMSSLPDPSCKDLHRVWSAQRQLWPDRSWRASRR